MLGSHARAAKPEGAHIQLNDRVVDLNGGIGMAMIKKAQSSLLELDAQSHAPIWLRINSGGGSVEAGLILIDTMKALQSPVKCLVESKAYSMAAIILVFCAEKYVMPHATLMLHEASYGTAGEDPTNRARLDFLSNYLDSIHEEIAAALGMPVTTYRKKIRDAWWIMSKEATREGIVDGIVTRMDYRKTPVTQTETKDTLSVQETTIDIGGDQPVIPKRR